MNKERKLQRDIRILEDEVKMIKDSKSTWIASSIAFGFILVILSIFLFIYPEEMGVYKQGFQDGLLNASLCEEIKWDSEETIENCTEVFRDEKIRLQHCIKKDIKIKTGYKEEYKIFKIYTSMIK